MINGIKIWYRDHGYRRINAIISRKYIANEPENKDPPRLLAELYAEKTYSVEVVPLDAIELTPISTEKGRKTGC